MDPACDSVLDQYEVYRGTRHSELPLDSHSSVLKAVFRHNKDQPFLIHRQTFPRSKETLRRLEQLRTAAKTGVLLAADVDVREDSEGVTVFVVEPVRRNVEKLDTVLSEERLTKTQKAVLFKNIVTAVGDLHSVGVPHLELSPDSIFIENKSAVFLRAFHILPLATRSSAWYHSPEQVFSSKSLSTQPHCDIWALGCIFSDLFLSLTPLFQSVEADDRLHRLFEVMGLPPYSTVREYISAEVYDNLQSIDPRPAISSLTASISHEETEYLLSMLSFDPRGRPPPATLLSTFPEDRFTPFAEAVRTSPPYVSSELANGPYEFYERSGTASMLSSGLSNNRWNLPLQTTSSDKPRIETTTEDRSRPSSSLPTRHTVPTEPAKSPIGKATRGVGVGSLEPIVQRYTEDVKIPDNQLIVNVVMGKNLL